MKTKIFFIASILALSNISNAFASSNVSVRVNDSTLTFDCNPIIQNDRVLVPVRAIFEKLGATVEWDETTKTITSKKSSDCVILQIDSNKMIQNGQTIYLDCPPKIQSDRTLVPIRAISEAFGAKVNWDDENRCVNIFTSFNGFQNVINDNLSLIIGDFNNNSNSQTVTENNQNSNSKPEEDANNDGLSNNGGSSNENSSFVNEVLSLVNEERAKAGLQALTLNNDLNNVAFAHSKDMGTNNFMSHTGSDGSSPFDRIKAGGISYRTAAENVAAGQSTPKEVMNSWMNSSGHRANILNANYTQIVIGYYNTNSRYRHFWTQCFIG